MPRHKSVINWAKVNKYLQSGCNGIDIASLLGIHYNTFYNAVKDKYKCDFGEYSQQKKGEGIVLMEESIFRDALKKGGVDRMFWLKNKAGWKDKTEFDHNVNISTLPTIVIKTKDVTD